MEYKEEKWKMFGFGGAKIDNSDRAVKSRVNYLRMKSPNTQGFFKQVNDPVIAEIPREISWNYRGYAVGVGYAAGDYKNYTYKPEIIGRARDLERNAGWTRDGRPFTFEECLLSVVRTDTDRIYTPRNLMFYDAKNVVIKYDMREINGIEDLQVPTDILALGLNPKSWDSWLDWSLENYYWEGAGVTDIDEREFTVYDKKTGEYTASYVVRVEPIIDLEINGCRSYAFNLTATEKERIIERIRNSKELCGVLLSDGKEDIKYVRRAIPGWSDKEIAKSVNSIEAYGYRDGR